MRMCSAVAMATICCAVASCGGVLIHHDQAKAAAAGVKFIDLAFVKSDWKGACEQFSKQMQDEMSEDKLRDEIEKNLTGGITQVAATEYEPISGQKAMYIYIKGMHGEKPCFFRLLMVGDSSGYKVGNMAAGDNPYPPSNRRPL